MYNFIENLILWNRKGDIDKEIADMELGSDQEMTLYRLDLLHEKPVNHRDTDELGVCEIMYKFIYSSWP